MAIAIKDNPGKETKEKITRFNTYVDYAYNMPKLKEFRTKSASGIFYFNNPH